MSRDDLDPRLVDNGRPLIEPRGAVMLDSGHQLAWCIDRHGNPAVWLIDPDTCSCDDCASPPRHTGDASPRSAPHEQDGPLPPAWRRRVYLATQPLCGRPRRGDGGPCRIEVRHDGDACHHHGVDR
jgi:hypothetical protein